ncbi:MAG TPA: glycosyltransferase family 39 protein [Bacteroidia bacterium]|nr:glycosyltransferase family 39 protein [Bacteroidia bacterium]
MNLKKSHFFELSLVLLLAALVRLHGLTSFSLSNDELSALARLRFDSFSEMIKGGVYPDFHPAGIETFLYFWTMLFGNGEWMVRLPFALLGIGSVFLLFKIGERWFSPAAGLAAAAAFSVLEYPLLYSQIARPYSPGLFFVLLATYFWTRMLFPDKDRQESYSWKTGLLFSLSVSACMYVHYFSFISAGLLCITGLFFLNKSNWRYYIFSGILIVVLYIPHFQILIHQLAKGGVGGADGWLGPPDGSTFMKYIDYGFNNAKYVKYLFLGLFFGTAIAYKQSYKITRFHLFAVLFFLVPYLIAYYYSIYKNPVLQFSVLLFSFPFLILFATSLLPRINNKAATLAFVTIILAGCSWSSFAVNRYYTQQHFTEFRGIAERIKQIDDKLGVHTVSRAINIHDPFYINYYLRKLNHLTPFGIYRISEPGEIPAFAQFIDTVTTPYFIYAFSNMYDDPKLEMMVRSKFPYLLLRDSMLNSGLRLYCKLPVDSALNNEPYHIYNYGFESNEWDGEQLFRDSAMAFSGKYAALITPENEYGPTFNIKLSEFPVYPGSRIEVSAAFESDEWPCNGKLILSIDDNEKNISWQGEPVGRFLTSIHKWGRVYLVAEVPGSLSGNEVLKLYYWNEKKESARMDDVKIAFYGKRP